MWPMWGGEETDWTNHATDRERTHTHTYAPLIRYRVFGKNYR